MTELGRLLALGDPADGAWLAEAAAAAVLRGAASAVHGAALGPPRLRSAAPAAPPYRPLPVPPGALPPGPLRIVADVSVWSLEKPLPALTAQLRSALFGAATTTLGLDVTEVDLRVAELLDGPPGARAQRSAPEAVSPSDPAGAAAAAVPGVARLTATLGRAVHHGPDHVRVEFATAEGHRPLDVARAVRASVAAVPGNEGRPVTAVVTHVF